MQCPNDSTKSQHKRCSSDEAHNERIYTGKSIQVTQVYHMQCALNNVTRKVNINASSSTATTATEMQTLGRANTTCTSHKKD